MLANEKTQTAKQDGAARTRPFTSQEYFESLRDGREIWIYGERVKDVTTHPAFRFTKPRETRKRWWKHAMRSPNGHA
jgi:hypothetical protein